MKIFGQRIALVTAISVAAVIASGNPASAGVTTPRGAAAIVATVPGLNDGVSTTGSAVMHASSIGVTVKGKGGQQDFALTAPGHDSSKTSTKGGTRTYEDTAKDVDTVAQTLGNGARILEVIRSADAPASFDYQVTLAAGETIKEDADGTLMIGKSTRKGDQQIMDISGVIGAPWARDAVGKNVPAKYVVQGNTIRMEVTHSEAVSYPVVADPTYTRGGFQISWSIFSPTSVTVLMNKARSEDFAAAKGVLCIGIAFVPIVGPVLAAICGVSAILDAVVYRYGWCSKVVFETITRRVTATYYRGGFCT